MRQENGVSIKSRIADLDQRLQERNREGQTLEREDGELKSEVNLITLERNDIKSKNKLLMD